MTDKLQALDKLAQDARDAVASSSTRAELAQLKADYIGKKGKVSEVLRTLKDADPKERASVGSRANQYKQEIEALVDARLEKLERESVDAELARDWVDISLRNSQLERGLGAAGYHPLLQLQQELEDIFLSMGFEILDGPHIEDEFHNFSALNIPADHPARDMQDTFWFPDRVHLLRTQTSPIQIRGMKTRKPPFKFIGPGKVFRCERTDATHEMSFHQLEGMMVGRGISVANLLYFAKTLFREIFGKEVRLRVRPSYFPFVEPGLEIDMNWEDSGIAGGRTGWLEMMGCGLVHPKVLRAGGIDPNEFSGFAFGLGIDRLLMMRYGIDDIRHIHSGDLRFVSQFRVL